jgi:hypothetical protein
VYFYLLNNGTDVSGIGWLPVLSLVFYIIVYSFGKSDSISVTCEIFSEAPKIIISSRIYGGDSMNKVTRPLTCVVFLISFKFPARSEQVEHRFLSRTLGLPSYHLYCRNISCKMAGLAETWSNIKTRSVIRFLRLKGTSPAEIHRQLVEVG